MCVSGDYSGLLHPEITQNTLFLSPVRAITPHHWVHSVDTLKELFDIKRLLENYCFVPLTNRALPQISDDRPDVRQRALFVDLNSSDHPGACVSRYWTGSDSVQETHLDVIDMLELCS